MMCFIIKKRHVYCHRSYIVFVIAILIIASIVAIVRHADVQSFAQPKTEFESKKQP